MTARYVGFLDVRPGEAARIGLMAGFLFLLLAANNVIKIVRDALFLSRFSITELAYVYLLAALLAIAVIGLYSRYTSKFSLAQIILGSQAFIIGNLIIFWLLITFYDSGAILYGFYIWSAIVGLIAVAQFWTLANEMFNPREGKRLFGIITAAGTLGAMTGAFGANLSVSFFSGTSQLLWLIVVFFSGAFGVAWFALKEGQKTFARTHRQEAAHRAIQARDASGIVSTLRESRYLRAIAALLFVSVIVSTLIDYQFKAAAKSAYPREDALAGFFGSYYASLSIFTLVAQVWLTGRFLTGLGLTPSLFFLPITLLVGSTSLLVWPGLFTATATRLAEASLRTSVNGIGVQILYLPIPDFIKKKVKVFLDVTVERLGDGTAALIILFCTFYLGSRELWLVSYFSIGLILIWAVVVFTVRQGYMEALRRSLALREISLEQSRIDFGDKETIEAVLTTLEDKDERTVLFGLNLAQKLEPAFVAARLPRNLLRHSSREVRAQAVKLFAMRPDQSTMSEIKGMLKDQNYEVQAEAISAACIIFKAGAFNIVSPYLESPNPTVKRRSIECLLRHGDKAMREAAHIQLHELLDPSGSYGEQGRIEAAGLMGAIYDSTFAPHLGRLIREDASSRVIHAAMAAAGKAKYPDVLGEIVSRLCDKDTKIGAREALIEYGEAVVNRLRDALFDSRVSRDIRLNVPRTLSKIHSQAAMNALLSGLLEEDRSIRFQAILALEEMARRFTDLKLDRDTVEGAIASDVMLYSRRFAIFYVLFAGGDESGPNKTSSLLRQALVESMERIRERVLWLLSLIHSAKDIRVVWAALNSSSPTKRAHAVELLDNLLRGEVRRYGFLLYGDALDPTRFSVALGFIGWRSLDVDTALHMLLQQEDVWLTAATVWEIGVRRLAAFREEIAKRLKSENAVVREAAELVIQRI